MIVQAFLFSTYMILSLLLGRYIGSSRLISGWLRLASLGYFSCLLVLIEQLTIDGPLLINDLLCISAPSASPEVCPPPPMRFTFMPLMRFTLLFPMTYFILSAVNVTSKLLTAEVVLMNF